MSASPAPVPVGWTLSAQATSDGVALRLAVPARGVDAVLAAAGDATERTYPRPPIDGT